MTTNLPQKNHATGLEEKRRELLLVSNKSNYLITRLASLGVAADRPTLTRRQTVHLDGVIAAWVTVDGWSQAIHDRAELYRNGGDQSAEQDYLAVLDFEYVRLSARLPSFSPSRARRNDACRDYFAMTLPSERPVRQTPNFAF